MATEIEGKTDSLYDKDYYLWLKTTINQLRAGQLASVDLDNLIEELESMGRSEKRAIKSLLIRLFEHLLKHTGMWNESAMKDIGRGKLEHFAEKLKMYLKIVLA